MQDYQIVDLYWERNEAAIRETEQKYGSYLSKVAYNILADYEDSKECVNDTYLALWNTIPPSNPDPFIAFICKITRNLSVKKLRHKNAQKRSAEVLP
ncbi:MAG: sigma factor, partial [Oscillospiraceae bacterium]|nr:sigma factor [Oscillospiraceae bacterium]